MKIQCDFCHKAEASIFCAADEAALCTACDRRVHQANKLAGKHPRFSLLQPSSGKEAPRCDVCQERRALLFCQEDRAILCRECDIPIHSANQHTGKHNRFLLTGVKLSGTAGECPREASPVEPRKNADELRSETDFPTVSAISGDGGSTSSISDYLMKTLPGWHVEDLLDSYYDPHSMCKMDDPYNELAGILRPAAKAPAGIQQVPDKVYKDQPSSSVAMRQNSGDDLCAVPMMNMFGKRSRTG